MDNVHSLEDFTEDDMSTVKPSVEAHIRYNVVVYKAAGNSRSDNSGDEKLRSVGIWSSVGHGQKTGAGVLQLEVLIGEFVAVDCLHDLISTPIADEQGQ